MSSIAAIQPMGMLMLALSIRQPYAELILRGIKRVEYRTRLLVFKPAKQIIDPLKGIPDSKIAVVAWRQVVEVCHSLRPEMGGRLEFIRDFYQSFLHQLVVDVGLECEGQRRIAAGEVCQAEPYIPRILGLETICQRHCLHHDERDDAGDFDHG